MATSWPRRAPVPSAMARPRRLAAPVHEIFAGHRGRSSGKHEQEIGDLERGDDRGQPTATTVTHQPTRGQNEGAMGCETTGSGRAETHGPEKMWRRGEREVGFDPDSPGREPRQGGVKDRRRAVDWARRRRGRLNWVPYVPSQDLDCQAQTSPTIVGGGSSAASGVGGLRSGASRLGRGVTMVQNASRPFTGVAAPRRACADRADCRTAGRPPSGRPTRPSAR